MTALIEFADEAIGSTHLTLGVPTDDMTDQAILDCYNDCVRAQEHLRATHEHVAIEIPVGWPQIRTWRRRLPGWRAARRSRRRERGAIPAGR